MLEFDCVECGFQNNPAENTHCYSCRKPRPIPCPHCRVNNSYANTHCYSCGNSMHHINTTVTYASPIFVPVPVVVYEDDLFGHHGHHNHYDTLIDLDGDGHIDIIIDND